ncbi:MAG TPA: glycosyltransferase [Opitutaceae bacterium]|jgi:glycosyltransferase involved in cell wall biosynthesis
MTTGRARILLITSGPLCRNPRVLKEAWALGSAGYDVQVFTVANQGRSESYDRELMRGAPFRRTPVNHLARDPRGRLGSVWDRGLTWLGRRGLRLGWQGPAALGPYSHMRSRARRYSADLTIVHTELGLAVGADLLRLGRRVAADIEDWHSRDLLPSAQRNRPLRLLDALERRMVQRGAYVSTTSHSLARALAEAYGAAPPAVIRNVFPLQPPPGEKPDGRTPSLFWFSQTVGPGRMLELFLAAWARTRQPSRVCLLGETKPSFRDKLLRRLPVEKRGALDFVDLVSPGDLPGLIARHDVGLALEASVPDSRNLTITNKLFQYLNAGLPVIATPTAGQCELLAEAPQVGWLMDLTQTTAAAAQIDSILEKTEERRSRARAARAVAEQVYCWERESERLLASVARAVGPS